jgi:hypothetical protein
MTYYVDELQRPDTDRTVYRDSSKYDNADIFMNQVCDWLKEHNIDYIWRGHGTRTNSVGTILHVTVSIPDEKSALLFLLRWS